MTRAPHPAHERRRLAIGPCPSSSSSSSSRCSCSCRGSSRRGRRGRSPAVRARSFSRPGSRRAGSCSAHRRRRRRRSSTRATQRPQRGSRRRGAGAHALRDYARRRVPAHCEAFPGTALDLRVDPANPNNVVVVGPVGFERLDRRRVRARRPQRDGRRGARSLRRVTALLVSIAGFFLVGVFLSFVASSASSSKNEPETPEPPSPPSPKVVVPIPTITKSPASTPAQRADCAAAERCCHTLGAKSCSFASMSDAACKAALRQEEAAAAKLGKACK